MFKSYPSRLKKIGVCHPDDQKMVNNKSLNGFNLIQFSLTKLLREQECIPVRCIPSTAVAAGGGVSQHALGMGVCIPACTGQGEVCIPACTG